MAEAARTALVAGAVGRLGEALLNRVLASGDYRTVVALAQAPMALGVRGLALASLVDLPREAVRQFIAAAGIPDRL